MDRNLLIGAALALVVTGVGVTVGFHIDHRREAALAAGPTRPARAPAAAPIPGRDRAAILERLGRVERDLAELRAQQAALQEALRSTEAAK